MASQIPEKKTVKQSIRDELKKIRSFGWKDGIQYVWDYYKIWILLIVLVPLTIVIVSSGDSVREMVLHCSFSAEAFYDHADYLQNFDAAAGLNVEEQYSYIEPMTRLGLTAGERHSNWINTEQLDMIVADSTINANTMKLACFFDLTTFLPEDLVEEFEDKFYYYENEAYGVAGNYAVDVSEYFGYADDEDGIYHDGLYICIPANTKYPEQCIAFLRYIVDYPPTEHVPAE